MDDRQNKYRNLFVGRLLFLTAIASILVALTYPESEPAEMFTTNIDLRNKTINDIEGESEPRAIIGTFFESGKKIVSRYFNVWRLYQNMANPYSRYVVLDSGVRKEEVAKILAEELNWSDDERKIFMAMDQIVDKENREGRYSPGGYLIPASATPLFAYETILNKFKKEVESRYASSTAEVINMNTALKIASIIEREAAGPHDMRLISGIIWNRIFKEMNLEVDATLQYAKGNEAIGWWPRVRPEDKYIDSPYNTYKNKGLPPTPISNISISALKAALNPKKTECIFYIHDKVGKIHCSKTYQEHLSNIKRYYGKK